MRISCSQAASFRDGRKDQTRNLEVIEVRKIMSGFRVRAFSAPRNDGSTPTSRRARLLAQLAIIDIADRDRPPGNRAAQSVGKFQRQAAVERGVDGLEIGRAGVR